MSHLGLMRLWQALEELRPRGNIMRARNVAYRVDTKERGAAAEPKGWGAVSKRRVRRRMARVRGWRGVPVVGVSALASILFAACGSPAASPGDAAAGRDGAMAGSGGGAAGNAGAGGVAGSGGSVVGNGGTTAGAGGGAAGAAGAIAGAAGATAGTGGAITGGGGATAGAGGTSGTSGAAGNAGAACAPACGAGHFCEAGACHLAAVQLVAGNSTACALLSDGTVRCWGQALFVDPGTGTMPQAAPPMPVPGISTAVALASGQIHFCAVLRDASLVCWGLGSSGELGNGLMPDSSPPVTVYGLDGKPTSPKVTAIGGSTPVSCAVAGGALDCWGYNAVGTVGDGDAPGALTDPFVPTPAPVVGLDGTTPAKTATAVTGGDDFTCALLGDGTVDCWGDDLYGQLGNGTSGSTPVPVPKPVMNLANVTAISAARARACALRSDGTVWCWGTTALTPGVAPITQFETTPKQVPGWTGVKAIAVSIDNTCGLMAGGLVQCLGSNQNGQLGDGSTTDSDAPVPVKNLSGVTAIAAGTWFACALLSDGSVRCWGYDQNGALGDGTMKTSPVPVPVLGW